MVFKNRSNEIRIRRELPVYFLPKFQRLVRPWVSNINWLNFYDYDGLQPKMTHIKH